MAKKSLILRNERRKELIKQQKILRKDLKKKIKDQNIDINEKLKLIAQLHDLKRDGSSTRLIPACHITGRSKGAIFYKVFGVSRHMLRELIISGKIPGIVKVN